MTRRGLLSGAVLALAIASVPPAVVVVASQAPATAPATSFVAPKSDYNPPRTPWGDPDLMGVWDYQTVTRMQRPADLKGKARFTETEYLEWATANAPTRDECAHALSGNLCRCGDYNKILNSAMKAAEYSRRQT